MGGATFRYAIGEPTAITPWAATGPDALAVVDALYDALVQADAAGRPRPSAAVGWTSNAAATRWTFDLRPGATFHDGSPVTADAFVDGLTRLAAEGPMGHLLRDVVGYDALRRGDVGGLAGLRAPSPLLLQLDLVRPRADLPTLLGHPSTGPLHPDGLADPGAHAEQPIGNGPFRMDEPWARGDFIRTTSWDGWRNGTRPAGGLAEVLFRIADVDTGFLAFRQGRRDFAAVPPEALALAAEEYPPRGGDQRGPGLLVGPRPATYLLVLDRDVPPYDDRLVREAVSLFVDRGRIAAEVLGGNLDPATGLLPPVLSPASQGICELCTFNPSGGSTRLAEADVRSLPFAWPAGGGNEQVRDVLREALGAQGALLVSNGRGLPPTFAAFLERLRGGGVGMYRLVASVDVPSALELLRPLLHSEEVPARGGLNFSGYADPTVDALLDQAARTPDDDARAGLLRRVEDIVVNRDHVVVPVVTYRHAAVAAEGFANVRFGPYGRLNLEAIRVVGGG